jgi:hypothetical protein
LGFRPNGPPRPELARSLVLVIRLTALVSLNLRKRAGDQGLGAYQQGCTGLVATRTWKEKDAPVGDRIPSSLVAVWQQALFALFLLGLEIVD